MRQTKTFITKVQDGTWRWVAVSSNSYQDRTGEVIAYNALVEAVELMNSTKKYGPLLWFHDPRLVLGTCDFAGMYNKFLVESGTFVDEVIPELIAPFWWLFGISIGFYHPDDQPVVGEDGIPVYGTGIEIAERSLLPWEWAANPYTALHAGRTDMAGNNDTVQALTELLGPQKVGDMLNFADQMEIDLTASGAINKAAPTEEQPMLQRLLNLVRKSAEPDELKAADGDGADDEDDTDELDTNSMLEAISKGIEALQSSINGLVELSKTQTNKAAGDPELTGAIKELNTLLKTLTQPAKGEPTGYRASTDPATATTKAKEVAEQEQPVLSPFDQMLDVL